MEKSDIRYQTYLKILREELVPAMGCTEPIAVAYAAARARQVLEVPLEAIDKAVLRVSGSIIKNVKSVIVPNTGHLKGLEAAVVAGVVAGNADRELEVLAEVTPGQQKEIAEYLKILPVEIVHIEEGSVFDIDLCLTAGDGYARIRISDTHTNIVLLEKNGKNLLQQERHSEAGRLEAEKAHRKSRELLCMEGIWDFVNSVAIEDVEELLERQIQYNMAIAEEGLRGDYGSNIGSVLMNVGGDNVRNRARAKAAAGSDARMNGCELPVVINSGSGNQGITCSVPVIEYAREFRVDRELLLRALTLSNLTTIYQKTGIGTLSAYCGAVCAAAGAGAGIVYLREGSYEAVIHTIVNTLATVSGIVCDGAKASCAAKIAAALDTAFLGYDMFRYGEDFHSGDGIVMEDIEATIRAVGKIGHDGMRETNEEIIRLMLC